MTSRHDYQPLKDARVQIAEHEARRPVLIAERQRAAEAVDAAQAGATQTKIGKILGRVRKQDADQAATDLKAAIEREQQAADAVAACEDAVDTLRLALPQLEAESRAAAWPGQRAELLALASDGLVLAQQLADVQTKLSALRHTIDAEHYYVPPDPGDNGRFDGPAGRTVLPGDDLTILAVASIVNQRLALTPQRVAVLRERARLFGAKV